MDKMCNVKYILKLISKIFGLLYLYYAKGVTCIKLYFNGISIKKCNMIRGIPYIKNNGQLIIENDVIINSYYAGNPIGGQTKTTFWIKNNGIIIIKKGARISNSTFVSANKILISENVYIGGDCKIYDTNFHSIDFNKRILDGDSDVKSCPIIIEKGAFIGGGSIILKGVIIGEKSVIGAGSVVTNNIPEGEIWGGNPAKFIKKL